MHSDTSTPTSIHIHTNTHKHTHQIIFSFLLTFEQMHFEQSRTKLWILTLNRLNWKFSLIFLGRFQNVSQFTHISFIIISWFEWFWTYINLHFISPCLFDVLVSISPHLQKVNSIWKFCSLNICEMICSGKCTYVRETSKE